MDTIKEMQDRIAELEADAAALRAIVSDVVTALGTGATCAPDASLEFMRGVPEEVRLTIQRMLIEEVERGNRRCDAMEASRPTWQVNDHPDQPLASWDGVLVVEVGIHEPWRSDPIVALVGEVEPGDGTLWNDGSTYVIGLWSDVTRYYVIPAPDAQTEGDDRG